MDQPHDTHWSRRLNPWLRGFALIGIAACLVWFYSLDLPNAASFVRRDIWNGLVDLLLENVFPTQDPHSPPPPSGWHYLPQRLGLFATAGFVLIAAGCCGHLILRGLRLREVFDHPMRLVLAMGLGLSAISLQTLACGGMGLLHRGLHGALLLMLIALEVSCRLRSRRVTPLDTTRSHALPWYQRSWDAVGVVCLVAVMPFVLAMVLGAALPSIDFDVKEYHLEGPKEYFLQGRVGFLAHNVYTSFPFLTEMLSLLGMILRDDWFSGALVGKLILMSFAPLTALGLYAAGRRWFDPTVGWLCVLLYLSTPWIYRISIIAYAEGGLTFYLLATLFAVMIAADESPDRPMSPRMILLCGLLAGSAVACKYPGVISVAIPLGGFLLLETWRRALHVEKDTTAEGPVRGPHRVRALLHTTVMFTLGTLLTFGPWMSKNIIETGNPVYPLLYNVFGGADWDADSHRKWQQGHPPTIVKLADRPAALVSNLGTRILDVIARSDWQSPLLFAGAFLAWLWPGRRRLVVGLWLYAGWLFLVWWALTHQIDRFWVPMLPVVTLLAGIGWGAVLDPHDAADELSLGQRWLDRILTAAGVLLIGAAVLFNLAFITTGLCGYNAYLIDLETARRDVTAPGIALVAEQLPAAGRVLFVGEAQVFDADFDVIYNTVFDESLFERWTSAAVPGVPPAEQPLRSTDQIRKAFAEHGITHVFVNWSEVLRYRLTYGYTEYVSPQRFADLVQAGVLVPVPLDPMRTLRLWEDVDPAAQKLITEWGATLHRQVGDHEALQQYQLFEVR